MTTTHDAPPAGPAGAASDDARGQRDPTPQPPPDPAPDPAPDPGAEPDPYRLDPAREAHARTVFDQQLGALADAEHQKSLLAHREITALLTAHRHAYALLPAGTRPGAPRPHAPGTTDRGDTWLDARELVLCQYAPACSLSMRTAAHRFDQALDASQYYPDTLTALTDPDSGITPQKLAILIRETPNLTLAHKRAVEAIVLPHAAEDTSTAWARRIRTAIVTVLGAPLAARIRRRREEDRYIALVPDGMIAQLLGELPLAQARALDLALDALADTAEPGDARTHAQRRIDALLTCVLGPAVFLARPAGTTNHGHNDTGDTGGSGSGGAAGPNRDNASAAADPGDATDTGSARGAGAAADPGDGPAWPQPRDEDEPVPDYGHGQPDERDIGRREAAHERAFTRFLDTSTTTGRPAAPGGTISDPANTAKNTDDGTGSDGHRGSRAENADGDADGSDGTGSSGGEHAGDTMSDDPGPDLDTDEQNPYRELPLPVFGDWDEPQLDPHAPEDDGQDPLTRALWNTDGGGVFGLVDPDQAERVTELWDLIRQLAARINLTIPTPPDVHLDVTIPVELLAGSDRASPGAHPARTTITTMATEAVCLEAATGHQTRGLGTGDHPATATTTTTTPLTTTTPVTAARRPAAISPAPAPARPAGPSATSSMNGTPRSSRASGRSIPTSPATSRATGAGDASWPTPSPESCTTSAQPATASPPTCAAESSPEM